MFANGEYILNKNGVDETTRAVKFIKNPDSDDLTYILSTREEVLVPGALDTTPRLESKVLTYPDLSTAFYHNDCMDAVCRYGGEDWFWKTSATSAWMYVDHGSGVERKLPRDIDLASATRAMTKQEYFLADGLMYAPTYLKCTKLETEVGPALSIESGCKIDGLGISKSGLLANMTLFNDD